MNDRYVEGQDLFTLVTYTPEPLRRWLVDLRRLLPVEANSQPHITILPPRPLTMPVEEARQKLTSVLARWTAFEIELTGVEVFPGTNVLYLDVRAGSEFLSRLHAELNQGSFAYQEPFPFHPHVTVGGPVPKQDLAFISRKAGEAWKSSLRNFRFKIQEIAFVSIAAHGIRGDWRRLWVHGLAGVEAYEQLARAAITNQTF
ncbi:MAG TPA: 2'-5' RNA ligase family protein [Bryobacteraceae bacterium]|nr:2'-5' RNA ligase family protein [Bryobacteraceae bacterium]